MATKKKTTKKPKPTATKGKKKTATTPVVLTAEQLAIKVGDMLYRAARIDGNPEIEAREIRQAGKVGLVLVAPFVGMGGSPVARASVWPADSEISTTRIGAVGYALDKATAALRAVEDAYDQAETNVADMEQLHDALLAEADESIAAEIAKADALIAAACGAPPSEPIDAVVSSPDYTTGEMATLAAMSSVLASPEASSTETI